MKRTHLILKTATVAGLMVAGTAVGVVIVAAVATLGGARSTATDAAPELAFAHADVPVDTASRVADLLTAVPRGSAARERSVRSETGLCPDSDAQNDDLWEARATAKCFRRLDRSRGEGR